VFRLKPVQVVGGRLRMAGSTENRVMILPENLEPGGDIRRVVLLDFRCELEISAKECGTEFGNLS
jgi:hypothetical protein